MRTPNVLCVIGLRSTVLIGLKGLSLVSKDADGGHIVQLLLDEKSLSPVG